MLSLFCFDVISQLNEPLWCLICVLKKWILTGRSSMMVVRLNGYAWLMKSGRLLAIHPRQRRYKITDLVSFLHLQPLAHKEKSYRCRLLPSSIWRIGECLINCLILTLVTCELWCHFIFNFSACWDLLQKSCFIVNMASITSKSNDWAIRLFLFHPSLEHESSLMFHFLLLHIHVYE